MTTLFRNISTLVTHVPGEEVLTDAALVVEDGRIAWIGPNVNAPPCDDMYDLGDKAVIPGFVDSHSHLVHAGDRAEEFAARMAGTSYTAGGIRTTVAATRAADETALLRQAMGRVAEMVRSGATTFETKTGYGLTTEDEARLAAISSQITPETTFLGAHVVPDEFTHDRDGYINLVKGEMLSACAPYVRWIDVFCDRGAFTVDEAREILNAGSAAGLGLRLHANQLEAGEGVQLAVELSAASVDHCTHLSPNDIDALAASNTVATLLPAAEFSTRSPYPPARELLDAGATLALATDCNPGSSFTTSLPFCIAVAVREMKMTPYEALRAATLGGALALQSTDIGHLSVGSQAHFVVLDAPSYLHLAYRPGVDLIDSVYRDGFIYERSGR